MHAIILHDCTSISVEFKIMFTITRNKLPVLLIQQMVNLQKITKKSIGREKYKECYKHVSYKIERRTCNNATGDPGKFY